MPNTYMSQAFMPDGFVILAVFTGAKKDIVSIAWELVGERVHLAASAGDGVIYIWNTETSIQVARLTTDNHIAADISWYAKESTLASLAPGDKSVKLWDVTRGRVVERLSLDRRAKRIQGLTASPHRPILATSSDNELFFWHGNIRRNTLTDRPYRRVRNMIWSPDDTRVAVLYEADYVQILDTRGYQSERGAQSMAKAPSSFAWNPDGMTFAAGLVDGTVQIWGMSTFGLLATLEGHTAPIISCSYSADGKLLLTQSEDMSICVWLTESWNLFVVIDSSEAGNFKIPQFHPTNPSVLASVDHTGKVVLLWELDTKVIHNEPRPAVVQYTSAKIALVGDGSVGKSALGFRIADGTWHDTSATHGQQFWILDELRVTRADGTECEVILWDFAGQPDYRLIHGLFLDDVDLALILFDQNNHLEPLKGVEFWLKQLSILERKCKKVLVASKVDVGEPPISREDLEEFCQNNDIEGGVIHTSAFTGKGVEELKGKISEVIDWTNVPATITTQTFRRIKDYVIGIQTTTGVHPTLVTWGVLKSLLTTADPSWQFTEMEMQTAVRHLQTHGYVRILQGTRSGETVLLKPNVLIRLAASIVNEARGNPGGLGALQEEALRNGQYKLDELDELSASERIILLDAAIALFVKTNIALREATETGTLLVFPSLINQRRPKSQVTETVEGTTFVIRGAVEHIYPILVVRLGYTNLFRRTNQWQNQAEYEMNKGEICGFRQIEEHEGEIEIVLFYAKQTPQQTRKLFEELFRRFLYQRAAEVTEYPLVVCSECNTIQQRATVIKRIEAGKDFIMCEECSHKVPLPRTRKQVPRSQVATLENEQINARLRTDYAEKLTYFKRIVAGKPTPSCFISFAYGVREHVRWTAQLVDDLMEADINIIYYEKDTTPGTHMARFMSKASEVNYNLVIGTPKYVEKYNNVNQHGTGVAVEGDLITTILTGTEAEKETVIPILLAGDDKQSFPALLQGRRYIDFRENTFYFVSLFDLLLKLYGYTNFQKDVRQLRQDLLKAAENASV